MTGTIVCAYRPHSRVTTGGGEIRVEGREERVIFDATELVAPLRLSNALGQEVIFNTVGSGPGLRALLIRPAKPVETKNAVA